MNWSKIRWNICTKTDWGVANFTCILRTLFANNVDTDVFIFLHGFLFRDESNDVFEKMSLGKFDTSMLSISGEQLSHVYSVKTF